MFTRFVKYEVCHLFVSVKLKSSYPSKMPKKNSKYRNKDACEPSIDNEPVRLSKTGDVLIQVHAKPGAKLSQITEIGSESLSIQIGAPPVDGEANTELVKYLSKVLGVRKSEVTLEKGSKSREKSLSVSSTNSSVTVDLVMDKLKKEFENG